MTQPQRPKFTDTPEAWAAFETAYATWEQSPEGHAELANERAAETRKRQEVQAAYEENRAAAVDRLLESIALPERALGVVLAGKLQVTEALSAADTVPDLLVLSGGAGCGKTVAAVAWVVGYVRDPANWLQEGRAARFKSRPPIWVTAAKLARWERYDEDKMADLLRTPRLVVDDLGGEYMDQRGFYASLFDEIVNERQAASRPTILTTNLGAEAFKTRYGDRIVDRIREGGRFINCGNKSLRTQAA